MVKSLKGKVALVTGGSRGIGAAIARALAEEGADVVISYASSAAKADSVVHELKSKGVRAQAFKADQANEKEVEDLVKTVAKQFGRLDILVNNAGVFTTGVVQDGANNGAELERLFAVNVGGVVAAVRAASGVAGSSRSDRSSATPRPGQALPTIRRPRPLSPPIRAVGRAISGPRASPSTTCSRDLSIPT
jgi:NAD(P)-dependent dehydrogenase (short-subunit alcohol dehydrogenase family)